MEKRYLFSPIGNTDPIKYLHDGSMLHIARVYKPDIVYLYMSKEMLDNQKADERYTKTLELLGKKLNHKFEIHVIERENLVDVQDYNIFYEEFRAIIAQIESEMEAEDQLFLNMASGTPAMKSALVVLATLAEYRFHAIQVSTPKKKSNQEYEERSEYEVELNWEYNEDNEADFENRCKEVECLNLVRMLKINMIEKHLLAYDYHAAFEIGKELKKDISKKAKDLLELASERVKLNTVRMNQLLQKCGYKLIDEDDEKRKIFEYALGLQIKVKREEYVDFIRGITPICVDLLKILLKEKCGIELEDYCYYTKKGVMKWSRNKLEGTDIQKYLLAQHSDFRYDVVYSYHLNGILENICDDSSLIDFAKTLINTEQKVRNVAAHEIVSVTAHWIKINTGKTPEEILDAIKYLCNEAGVCKREKNWDSYDDINKKIIQELER